jgi:hypothetical protein
MEPSTLKTCKMCYKEISSRAKKCPYCLHWQYKMSMMIFHPLMALLPMAIVLVALGFFRQTIFSKGEDFTAYRDQIEIIETQLKFGENECGGSVVVMGTMVNSSDAPWEDVHLEVQFYDSEKNLMDTEQKEKYSFVVPANDSSTFKVSIKREFPEEQYDSCQVRILSAKDERAMF